MDPRKLFFDERLKGYCVYCGGPEDTRDHVPPKVFLDEPYPLDLAVVPACAACNNGASLNEEYLACILECMIAGTVEPSRIQRTRIQRKLLEAPSLASLMAATCKQTQDGTIQWHPDEARVESVLIKLSRGHIAFEAAAPHIDEPAIVDFVPIPTLDPDEARELLAPWPQMTAWPELGSRAFHRAVGQAVSPPIDLEGWVVVQPRRYRYRVRATTVQMILSEYLACTVLWD